MAKNMRYYVFLHLSQLRGLATYHQPPIHFPLIIYPIITCSQGNRYFHLLFWCYVKNPHPSKATKNLEYEVQIHFSRQTLRDTQ